MKNSLYILQVTSFLLSALLENAWLTYSLFSLGLLIFNNQTFFLMIYKVLQEDLYYTIRAFIYEYITSGINKPNWNYEKMKIIDIDFNMDWWNQFHLTVFIMALIGAGYGRRMKRINNQYTRRINNIIIAALFGFVVFFYYDRFIFHGKTVGFEFWNVIIVTIIMLSLGLKKRFFFAFPILFIGLAWSLFNYNNAVNNGDIIVPLLIKKIMSFFYGMPSLFMQVIIPSVIFSYSLSDYLISSTKKKMKHE